MKIWGCHVPAALSRKEDRNYSFSFVYKRKSGAQVLTAIELARNARIAANRAYLGALLGSPGAEQGAASAGAASLPGCQVLFEGAHAVGAPAPPANAGGGGEAGAGVGWRAPAQAQALMPDDPLVLVAARELARKAALAEATCQARAGRHWMQCLLLRMVTAKPMPAHARGHSAVLCAGVRAPHLGALFLRVARQAARTRRAADAGGRARAREAARLSRQLAALAAEDVAAAAALTAADAALATLLAGGEV